MKTNLLLGMHSAEKKFRMPIQLYFLLFIALLLSACAKEHMVAQNEPVKLNGLAASSVSTNAIAGKNVIMQGFYWDVPMGGTWWANVQGKVSAWASAGITSVWLPPCSKGASGGYSDGYDPYDYFDFGDYNQMGTTMTRYGNKASLQACITAAHSAGLQVYADIVMNHNYGGASQSNPNTGGTTNTSFTPASGIFPRSYNDFHPSTYEQSDAGVFSNYPDLCHKNPEVAAGLWGNANSVAKYYKGTLGFDGWRFDWVDGFSPAYVANFVSAAPGFAVTEYWGPSNGTSVSEIQTCINGSGVSSFDFPCMFALKNAFTNSNLALLSSTGMLCKSNPGKAVTFVTNHDVNYIPDNNKLQAYAFIMAHEGTPCVFYTDYESLLDKTKMNTLIWINKNLAAGTSTVLYSDNDEYVAKMSGSPGLVIYINNSGTAQSRSVTTNWLNSTIHDFANNSTTDIVTNGSGVATITCPANSYTIWSSNGTAPATVTVTLRMLEDVQNGNSLFFSGSNAALTNWGTGMQGTWNTGNYWTYTVTVPAGQELDFKVRKGTTGGSGNTWESGANHVISNPVNGTTYTVTFNGGF
jgi:alpha-amylase